MTRVVGIHSCPIHANHYNGVVSSSSAGVLPIIVVDRKASNPLHRQIYDGFRAAILRGDLRPGQRIPSSRELTSELRVSRFPVLNAYSQLLAEGYFESRVGAGTFVSGSLPEQQFSEQLDSGQSSQKPPVPSGPRNVARRSLIYTAFHSGPLLRGWGAFGVHQPAFDQFPFQIWSSLVARHSRNPSASAIHHVDPRGSERFRIAIGDYLRTARGVQCDPSQIMIVSGSQQALDITARVLVDPGSPVWVEEPGYRLARAVLAAAECRLVPVPVDNEGIDVTAGIRLCRKARAAFVTPSHHYPMGSTMSASRRIQLLNWAQSSGAWIVEDDYDSEYRYESLPIASLHGLDVNRRVIYIGTFSKVLFPSLRLGYIVIPADLVETFVAVRHAMDIFPPYLNQEVLADFIVEGHFARHIRRMRLLYGERRLALVDSLRNEFGDMLQIHGAEAGMHLAVTLPEGMKDIAITARAASERLWLWPLSPSYMSESPRHGFVMGFGSVATDLIPRAVRLMRNIVSQG
jgi:GntR family transcriptional regulator / MocR family aminotransferase